MAKKIIGDVNLSDLYLKQLPEILKDVSIDGHFFCSNNNCLSLIIFVYKYVNSYIK